MRGLPQEIPKCSLAEGLHFILRFRSRFKSLRTVTAHNPHSTPMKQCAFCLRPAKMTAEHIWSEWMGRLFSSYTGRYHVQWGVGPEAKTWKSKSIDAVARVVCERCNNGWMSDVDAEASATMSNMIRYGSAVSLLPVGIASIATFAYKAAVVVDCAGGGGGPFFPPAERKRFSAGGQLPGGVQVWLSTIRTKRLHSHIRGHYAKINTGRYRHFRVFVFTYSVGFLVVQLIAFRWGSKLLKRPRFIPYLRQADVFTPVSVPLWPPDGRPVLWPTEQYLTDQTIHQISERWGNIAEFIPS